LRRGELAAQAPIGRSCAKNSSASHWLSAFAQKFRLGNISAAPVWNYFGETEDFFLTFYAKK